MDSEYELDKLWNMIDDALKQAENIKNKGMEHEELENLIQNLKFERGRVTELEIWVTDEE